MLQDMLVQVVQGCSYHPLIPHNTTLHNLTPPYTPPTTHSKREEQVAAKRRALGNKLWARLIRAVLAKAQLQQEHGDADVSTAGAVGGTGGVEQGDGVASEGQAAAAAGAVVYMEGSDVEEL